MFISHNVTCHAMIVRHQYTLLFCWLSSQYSTFQSAILSGFHSDSWALGVISINYTKKLKHITQVFLCFYWTHCTRIGWTRLKIIKILISSSESRTQKLNAITVMISVRVNYYNNDAHFWHCIEWEILGGRKRPPQPLSVSENSAWATSQWRPVVQAIHPQCTNYTLYKHSPDGSTVFFWATPVSFWATLWGN